MTKGDYALIGLGFVLIALLALLESLQWQRMKNWEIRLERYTEFVEKQSEMVERQQRELDTLVRVVGNNGGFNHKE